MKVNAGGAGAEVQRHSFFTSPLNGSGQIHSPAALPREITPVSNEEEVGWARSRCERFGE
jgi:hypothetical protein